MSVISLDIGGTKTAAAVINFDGEIETKLLEKTPTDPDRLIETVVALIDKLISDSPNPVRGVGIGIAGLVDHDRGLVVTSPNLPLSDLPVGKMIGDKINLPISIDNDANMAALGEKANGLGRDLDDFVFLTLGTGIGGGIFTGGSLYRGYLGAAAEIGHMVISAHGDRCNCGRLGCFEAVASGTAVARMGQEVAERMPRSELAKRAAGKPDKITAMDVSELARQGEPESLRIFQVVGQFFGIGFGNIINIFSPEAIILGGGFAGTADLFLPTANNIMLKTAIDPRAGEIKLELSSLGNDAGLYGAAAMMELDLHQ